MNRIRTAHLQLFNPPSNAKPTLNRGKPLRSWDTIGRRAQGHQVALTLKIPYRDGTTHLVMSPLEFM